MLCAILWFLFFHVQATFGGRSRSRSGCRRKSRERQQQHRIWRKRLRPLPWPGFPLGFNTENVFAFHSVWCENLGWEKKWKAFFQPLFGADATFLYTWKSWRYDFLFNFQLGKQMICFLFSERKGEKPKWMALSVDIIANLQIPTTSSGNQWKS